MQTSEGVMRFSSLICLIFCLFVSNAVNGVRAEEDKNKKKPRAESVGSKLIASCDYLREQADKSPQLHQIYISACMPNRMQNPNSDAMPFFPIGCGITSNCGPIGGGSAAIVVEDFEKLFIGNERSSRQQLEVFRVQTEKIREFMEVKREGVMDAWRANKISENQFNKDINEYRDVMDLYKGNINFYKSAKTGGLVR